MDEEVVEQEDEVGGDDGSDLDSLRCDEEVVEEEKEEEEAVAEGMLTRTTLIG